MLHFVLNYQLVEKMWNFEHVDSVRKALDEIGGVCPRCVLRLSGVKNSREIRYAEEPAGEPQNGQQEDQVRNKNFLWVTEASF
jgi:hypothetical protein